MALPFALPVAAALLAAGGAKFFKDWLERNTLFRWEEMESGLRPPFAAAGLGDLSLRPEGRGVMLRFVVQKYGARIPVHLLLHPEELQLDRRVKLRIALLSASFGKAKGLYGRLVTALVALAIRFRGGLAEEVLHLAESKLGGKRRGNTATFDLTGLPQIQDLFRKVEKVPGLREVDLSWFLQCESLAIDEEGLRVYLLPSQILANLFSMAKMAWPILVPPIGSKGRPKRS